MRHFTIYKTILKLNFSYLIAYKSNMLNSILANSVWGIFSLLLIVILTSKTPSVFGWTRLELFLLFGIYNMFTSVFQFFFTRSFERFSEIINRGTLDSLLLKPVDSQFLMSFSYANFPVLLRVFLGGGFIAYVLIQMHYLPTLLQFLFTLILMLSSIIVLYSIWYIVSTCLIWWSSLSNLVGLMYEINGTTRYPQEMYRSVSPILFYTVLPLTLVSTIPTQALIGKATFGNMFLLVFFAVFLFLASRIFWKYALKFYTSAGG